MQPLINYQSEQVCPSSDKQLHATMVPGVVSPGKGCIVKILVERSSRPSSVWLVIKFYRERPVLDSLGVKCLRKGTSGPDAQISQSSEGRLTYICHLASACIQSGLTCQAYGVFFN